MPDWTCEIFLYICLGYQKEMDDINKAYMLVTLYMYLFEFFF